PFAAKFWYTALKPTLYAPCGPPWISNSSGYFLDGSKLCGLTIHPSTSVPFVERATIRSSVASLIRERRSSLTCETWVTAPPPLVRRLTSMRTTLGDASKVLRIPAATPVRDSELALSIWTPLVTGDAAPPPPDADAK